jgi:hypothetical protein
LKFVGWSFFILAAYIAIDGGHKLLTAERPHPSTPGIVLAVCHWSLCRCWPIANAAQVGDLPVLP